MCLSLDKISDISPNGSLALETSEPRPQRQIRHRMRYSMTGREKVVAQSS